MGMMRWMTAVRRMGKARWTTQWRWVVVGQAASAGMVARTAVRIPTAVLTHRMTVVEPRMSVYRICSPYLYE